MIPPTYEIQLRHNGRLIGDCRRIAENLRWERKRVTEGVDEIEFTINDQLLKDWGEERGITIKQLLSPYALDCRVIRNGVPIIGGFLAELPAYNPQNASANLTFHFDGYLNLLAGVYIFPTAAVTKPMGTMARDWIEMADRRANSRGKAFGFSRGTIELLAEVTQEFENYKTVKDAIADRADNEEGAGRFDVFFHPNRKFDIIADENFGVLRNYKIFYPPRRGAVSAMSISAASESGYSAVVLGLGAGDVSNEPTKNTVIYSRRESWPFIRDYGYSERLAQWSSVSKQGTLNRHTATELRQLSKVVWRPEIELSSIHVSPAPEGNPAIWLGDTVEIENEADATGMTNGLFRVETLSVTVSDTGAEKIVPTLERL